MYLLQDSLIVLHNISEILTPVFLSPVDPQIEDIAVIGLILVVLQGQECGVKGFVFHS